MKTKILTTVILFLFLNIYAQRATPDIIQTNDGPITIQPIKHATFVLQWNDKTIYVDPYGGADAFKGIEAPDFILITDIHGDHTNLETLKELNTEGQTIVMVTHDERIAAQAGRTIRLADGKVKES